MYTFHWSSSQMRRGLSLRWASLLTFLLLQMLSESSGLPMKSCESKCGDIDIEYPFGIGANCSMNDWFVVVCNGTADNRRAFISSINLEVTDFLYERSRLRVKSPVVSFNCDVNHSNSVVDLRRTPFTVSSHNRFTVVGCKARALLTSAEPDIIGCQPTCNKKLKPQGRNPPCSGNRCCQTSIPYYLQVFKPSFQKENGKEGKRVCKLAFIVESTWFKSNIKDPYKVQEREYVPMLLDWKINATDMESLGINKETTNWSFRYYNGFGFPYPNNSMLMCRQGYAGNPYLPDGCQGTLKIFLSFYILGRKYLWWYKIVLWQTPIA